MEIFKNRFVLVLLGFFLGATWEIVTRPKPKPFYQLVYKHVNKEYSEVIYDVKAPFTMGICVSTIYPQKIRVHCRENGAI